MVGYVKELSVSWVSWLCVATAIGFGMEAGKNVYGNFKKKHLKNSIKK